MRIQISRKRENGGKIKMKEIHELLTKEHEDECVNNWMKILHRQYLDAPDRIDSDVADAMFKEMSELKEAFNAQFYEISVAALMTEVYNEKDKSTEDSFLYIPACQRDHIKENATPYLLTLFQAGKIGPLVMEENQLAEGLQRTKDLYDMIVGKTCFDTTYLGVKPYEKCNELKFYNMSPEFQEAILRSKVLILQYDKIFNEDKLGCESLGYHFRSWNKTAKTLTKMERFHSEFCNTNLWKMAVETTHVEDSKKNVELTTVPKRAARNVSTTLPFIKRQKRFAGAGFVATLLTFADYSEWENDKSDSFNNRTYHYLSNNKKMSKKEARERYNSMNELISVMTDSANGRQLLEFACMNGSGKFVKSYFMALYMCLCKIKMDDKYTHVFSRLKTDSAFRANVCKCFEKSKMVRKHKEKMTANGGLGSVNKVSQLTGILVSELNKEFEKIK